MTTEWPPTHADLKYGRHASFALAMRDPARYKAYRPIKRAIRQRLETGKRTITVGEPTVVRFDGKPRVLRAEAVDGGRQVHIWFLADSDAPRVKVAVVGTGHQFSGQWLATTAPAGATGLVWHVVKWDRT